MPGIFLVALVGVLIGRPFVREFAEVDQPTEVVEERTVQPDHHAADVDLGRPRSPA